MNLEKVLLTLLSVILFALSSPSARGDWRLDDDEPTPTNKVSVAFPRCKEILSPEHRHHASFGFRGNIPRMVATGHDKDFKLEAPFSSVKRPAISERSDLESLMSTYRLSRLQAAEVQARYRYEYNRRPCTEEDFLRLIKEVKAGATLSGIDPEKLATYKGVVAVDVDGTLLDQNGSRWKDGWTSMSALVDGREQIHVTMVPGWDYFLSELKSRNLGIVLYSRNSDHLIHGLAEMISIGGVSLKSYVDGILSSSHMTETRGPSDLKEEDVFLYKDLRLLDPSGTKAILVDDNLNWIRPEDLSRTQFVMPFSQSDVPSGRDESRNRAYRQRFIDQFKGVLANIDLALNAGDEKKLPFALAFAPYAADKEKELIDALEWLKKKASVDTEKEVMGTSQWNLLDGLTEMRGNTARRESLLSRYRDRPKGLSRFFDYWNN